MGGSAWSNQPIVAALIIIEGTVGGLFLYSGTPAHGNLVASIAAASGTDAFGNAYVAGIALYDSSGRPRLVQMFSANPNFEMLSASGAQIGNMSTLKDALLWYADTGSATQGALVASIAGKAGTDLFGNPFPQGLKVFQGEFDGTNFIINSSGAFFYSGTPALGNLIYSIANNAGLDTFGNAYIGGGGTQYSFSTPGGYYAFGPGVFVSGTNAVSGLGLLHSAGPGGPYAGLGGVTIYSAGGGPAQFIVSDASVVTPATSALAEVQGALAALSAAVSGASASGGLLTVQNTTASPAGPAVLLQGAGAGDSVLGAEVTGDSNLRFHMDDAGKMQWGSGSAGADTSLYRASAGGELVADPIACNVAGSAEGWHAVSFASSGLTGTLRVKLLPLANMAVIDGSIAVTLGASAATYTFGSLPSAAYYPAAGRQYPVALTNTPSGITATDPRIFVPTSGGLQLVVPSGSGAATASFTQMYPLD